MHVQRVRSIRHLTLRARRRQAAGVLRAIPVLMAASAAHVLPGSSKIKWAVQSVRSAMLVKHARRMGRRQRACALGVEPASTRRQQAAYLVLRALKARTVRERD